MSSVIYGDLLIYLFLFCSLKGVNCTLSLLTAGPTFLNKPRQILMPLQPKQTINRTCMCKFFSSFFIQILIPSLKKCDCWEVSTVLVFSFQVRQKKYSNLMADRHCLAPHWPLLLWHTRCLEKQSHLLKQDCLRIMCGKGDGEDSEQTNVCSFVEISVLLSSKPTVLRRLLFLHHRRCGVCLLLLPLNSITTTEQLAPQLAVCRLLLTPCFSEVVPSVVTMSRLYQKWCCQKHRNRCESAIRADTCSAFSHLFWEPNSFVCQDGEQLILSHANVRLQC